MPDPNADYHAIAIQSYLNATDLYNEARALLKMDSPRGYTLAEVSLEELIKAQLADMVAKGGARPEDLVAEVSEGEWRPILTRHASKQRLLTLFLLLRTAKAEGGTAKAEEVGKVLQETLTTDAVKLAGKQHIIDLILGMESNRKDSLYVGVSGTAETVKTPRRQVKKGMTEELLEIVEDLLRSVENNLMVSNERYATEAQKMADERIMRNDHRATQATESSQ